MKSKRRKEEFELEAKYALTPAEFEKLPDFIDKITRKRKLFLAGVRNVVLEDHYFDTPDYALARNHSSFRIRTRVGPVPKVSFKAPILLSKKQRSLYRRIELEGTLSKDLLQEISRHHPRISPQQFSIIDQPDYTAQKAALQTIDLHETIQLVNDRRIYTILYADGLTAELCLDNVRCTAGERSTSFHEMECEYLSGDANLMPKLCRFLEKHITWLQPSEVNKYERALYSMKVLDKSDKLRDQDLLKLRKALSKEFAKIEMLHDRVQLFNNPDDIHDYRVAMRRLLSGIKSILKTPDFSGGAGQYVHDVLKKLQRAFGAVRDSDVLIEKHISLKRSLGHKLLFDDILRVLLWKKTAAQYRALREADQYWTDEFLGAWRTFLFTDLNVASCDSGFFREYFLKQENQYTELRDTLAGRLIDSETLQFDVFEHLHKLRLQSKKLRYLADIFKELLPRSISGRKSNYKKDQELLGDINDAFNQYVFYHNVVTDVSGLRHSTAIESMNKAVLGELNTKIEKLSGHPSHIRRIELPAYGTPLESLNGIGPRIAERLGLMGLRIVEDLAALDDTTWHLIASADDVVRSGDSRHNWLQQARELTD